MFRRFLTTRSTTATNAVTSRSSSYIGSDIHHHHNHLASAPSYYCVSALVLGWCHMLQASLPSKWMCQAPLATPETPKQEQQQIQHQFLQLTAPPTATTSSSENSSSASASASPSASQKFEFKCSSIIGALAVGGVSAAGFLYAEIKSKFDKLDTKMDSKFDKLDTEMKANTKDMNSKFEANTKDMNSQFETMLEKIVFQIGEVVFGDEGSCQMQAHPPSLMVVNSVIA